MTIDSSIVGLTGTTVTRSWTADDAQLYAVAVGAGVPDASKELEFTTESSGEPQRVVPSFVCVAASAPLPESLDIDLTKMLHAEMSFDLHRPVPTAATVESTSRITGLFDKGSGALITYEIDVAIAETGERLATLGSSMFVRGEGGFGGDRGATDDWAQPDREPDATVSFETRPEQALIYRLTGDRNPLHSNPEFAKRSGFDRPILHGMCTYGFVTRALLHSVADSDPARFESFSARFSRVVMPGDSLTTTVWKTDDGALFRTHNQSGDIVLDKGRMSVRA
jgi:acyl dehydratase